MRTFLWLLQPMHFYKFWDLKEICWVYSYSDDFIATSSLEVPASDQQERCQHDDQQGHTYCPAHTHQRRRRAMSTNKNDVLFLCRNNNITYLYFFVFHCLFIVFIVDSDVLFSSDEPASAGEVNVEVPAWHSVGVVTRHPPKVTHNSHIYAFIYQYIIHLNVHIIHTYRPLYINI